jgi:hypothetical protein
LALVDERAAHACGHKLRLWLKALGHGGAGLLCAAGGLRLLGPRTLFSFQRIQLVQQCTDPVARVFLAATV